MKKPAGFTLLLAVFLSSSLTSCAPDLSSEPASATSTPIPQPTATGTATTIPTSTPLPGRVVLPVDTLGREIPWLPTDSSGAPGVNYVGINTLQPPFNNALVRRAFAHAIDRQVLVDMAVSYRANNPTPATSLTPPQILGRDLYGVVGSVFDPGLAKELLTEAGYADASAFPTVTFLVNATGDIAPGARYNMANAMAEMWKTHLGITVEVQALNDFGAYRDRLTSDTPDLFWFGWMADYNDPDNFIGELFNPTGDYHGEYNYGGYYNAGFISLVARAARSREPAERQALYIEAERILCETDAAVIPVYHTIYK